MSDSMGLNLGELTPASLTTEHDDSELGPTGLKQRRERLMRRAASRARLTRYAVGFGAKPMIAMRRILSDHGFNRLFTVRAG